MPSRKTLKFLLAGAFIGFLGFTNSSRACSVPVFRYALERWEAEPYQAILFYRGTLAKEDRAAWDKITSQSLNEDTPANVECHLVDLASTLSQQMQEIWEHCGGKDLPWMVALYPVGEAKVPVMWKGRFDRKTARALLDSPKRQEIARRILGGDSAVWVLLECGDKTKDEIAATSLSFELARLQKAIKLPSDDDDDDTATSDAGKTAAADKANAADQADAAALDTSAMTPSVPLKLAFSMVRVSRKNPAEHMFVKMLMSVAPDLEKRAASPLAFPIFGRGRVLGAIADDEINAEMIEEACLFLAEPCSCFVKGSYSGTDLLMAVNWEGVLADALTIDKALPPLTGVTAMLEIGRQADPTDPTDPADPRKAFARAAQDEIGSGGSLMRNTILAALALAVLAGVGAFLIRKRG